MSEEKVTRINCDLTITQRKNGLTFGTDAFLLAAFTSRLGGTRKHAADLGSGSGIIPLLLASRDRFAKIYAIEIQEAFAELIRKNAEENSLSSKIFPMCADVRSLKSADLGRELDVITANPPYMKIDCGKRNEHDEKFIARHEVCGTVDDFCAAASRLLRHGGKFCSVWRPDRLCDLMYSLRENKLEPKLQIFVCAYPNAAPSMVLTEAIKGGASGMTVTRFLCLSDSREDSAKNILGNDAKEIYDTCSFDSFLKK